MSLWDRTNQSVTQIYIHYRWVLTYLCVLPLNLVYNLYTNFRNRQLFLWKPRFGSHEKRVTNVQKQVKNIQFIFNFNIIGLKCSPHASI